MNELSEVSLDCFSKAFEMAKNKIQEYPHYDLLIYSSATVLNAALTLSDVEDEKKLEYNVVLVEWLERIVDRQDEKRWKKKLEIIVKQRGSQKSRNIWYRCLVCGIMEK